MKAKILGKKVQKPVFFQQEEPEREPQTEFDREEKRWNDAAANECRREQFKQMYPGDLARVNFELMNEGRRNLGLRPQSWEEFMGIKPLPSIETMVQVAVNDAEEPVFS